MSNSVNEVLGKDPTLPNIKLEIGGKARQLAFDFNAICIVSEETGINLLQAVISNIEAKNIRALLYASLLRDDPTITLETVGSWITMKNLINVRTAINAAWFASIEDFEQDDAKDEPASGEAQAQTPTETV